MRIITDRCGRRWEDHGLGLVMRPVSFATRAPGFFRSPPAAVVVRPPAPPTYYAPNIEPLPGPTTCGPGETMRESRSTTWRPGKLTIWQFCCPANTSGTSGCRLINEAVV